MLVSFNCLQHHFSLKRNLVVLYMTFVHFRHPRTLVHQGRPLSYNNSWGITVWTEKTCLMAPPVDQNMWYVDESLLTMSVTVAANWIPLMKGGYCSEQWNSWTMVYFPWHETLQHTHSWVNNMFIYLIMLFCCTLLLSTCNQEVGRPKSN